MEKPRFSQEGTILTIKVDTFEIDSTEDIRRLFFDIGEAIGKPLKEIRLAEVGDESI